VVFRDLLSVTVVQIIRVGEVIGGHNMDLGMENDFDWSKCVLCQVETQEPLVDPSKNSIKTDRDNWKGYSSLVGS